MLDDRGLAQIERVTLVELEDVFAELLAVRRVALEDPGSTGGSQLGDHLKSA